VINLTSSVNLGMLGGRGHSSPDFAAPVSGDGLASVEAMTRVEITRLLLARGRPAEVRDADAHLQQARVRLPRSGRVLVRLRAPPGLSARLGVFPHGSRCHRS
jgi:hypothetical protein